MISKIRILKCMGSFEGWAVKFIEDPLYLPRIICTIIDRKARRRSLDTCSAKVMFCTYIITLTTSAWWFVTIIYYSRSELCHTLRSLRVYALYFVANNNSMQYCIIFYILGVSNSFQLWFMTFVHPPITRYQLAGPGGGYTFRKSAGCTNICSFQYKFRTTSSVWVQRFL